MQQEDASLCCAHCASNAPTATTLMVLDGIFLIPCTRCAVSGLFYLGCFLCALFDVGGAGDYNAGHVFCFLRSLAQTLCLVCLQCATGTRLLHVQAEYCKPSQACALCVLQSGSWALTLHCASMLLPALCNVLQMWIAMNFICRELTSMPLWICKCFLWILLGCCMYYKLVAYQPAWEIAATCKFDCARLLPPCSHFPLDMHVLLDTLDLSCALLLDAKLEMPC